MNSIRRHLTVRLLIGTSLVGLGVLAAVFGYLRHELYEQFDVAIASRARTLGSLVRIDSNTGGGLEFELTERSAAEFRGTPRPDYFQIWDDHGNVVARSGSLHGADLPRPPADAPRNGRRRFFNLTLPDGRPGRAVEYAVEPGVEDVGDGTATAAGAESARAAPVTLILASDLAALREATTHVLWMLLIVFTAGSAAMVAMVVGTVRRGLRVLVDIGDAAGRVDPATLSTRFDAAGAPDELRPVVGKLNDLLDRLDDAFRRERRFTSNVAHELRTPIAELRSLAEVAIRWPAGAGGEAQADAHEALAIARQMERVVTALLAMARCQAGQEPLAFAPLEVSELVADAWRPHAAVARARGLDVDFGVEPATVESDDTILAVIVGNLLANAAAYARRGGHVECRGHAEARERGGRYVLEVLNDNDSLSEDDLRLLSEPFWRKDPARENTSNSGLGLALVAAYAKLLRVDVRFALRRPDVFAVTLEIPLSSREPQPAPASAAAAVAAAATRS